MASYTNLNNGKYKLFVELGYKANGKRDRRTKVVTASGPRAAARALSEFEEEVRNTVHIDNESYNFGQFVNRWRENYLRVELESSTQQTYETVLKAVIPYFERKLLKNIKTLDIVQYFAIEKEEGRGSLEKKYNILQSIFKCAIKWKVTSFNPMEGVLKPKGGKQSVNFYDIEELKILMKLINSLDERNKLLVEATLYGGLRRGEVLGIADDVINWSKNQLIISRSLQHSQKDGLRLKSTKTDNVRVVTYPREFIVRLHIYYQRKLRLIEEMGPLWQGFTDVKGKKVNLLFANELGIPLYPNSVTQFWGKFMKKHADVIKRVRFQDLRHSSASLLLSEGVNMKVVQKRLGHKNIKTTMNIYSHITEKDDEKASDIFQQLL